MEFYFWNKWNNKGYLYVLVYFNNVFVVLICLNFIWSMIVK